MKTLLLFIPTYNRLEKLKLCMNRLLHELAGLEDFVTIHVSDNHSTDGSYEFLTTLKHPSVTFSQNASNIGPSRNLCLAYEQSTAAEYTWIIGDDDIVLSGSLQRLLGVIRENPNSDFIFLNTLCYQEADKNEVIKKLELNNFSPNLEFCRPTSKSQFHSDFTCELRDLFDPRVDEIFLGSLMCLVWRSGLVKNMITDEELSFDCSKPKSCYPHTYNLLHSLKPFTPSLHLGFFATANFWHGGVEWDNEGYDLAVTHGLGIIVYEAMRLGYVSKEHRISFFAHYMAMAAPSYKKFLESSSHAFQERLADFHPQLAEMLLRYGATPLNKFHKNIWVRLSDLSLRKASIIIYNFLRRLKTIIFHKHLGG